MPLPTSALINNLTTVLGSGLTFNPTSQFSAPVTIPNAVENAEKAAEERASQSDDLVSNTSDLSSAVDQIIQQNKNSGNNNGALDYYDTQLITNPKTSNSLEANEEPDGFILYLIKPRKPAVDKALNATADFTDWAFDKISNSKLGSSALGVVDDYAVSPVGALGAMFGLDTKNINTEQIVNSLTGQMREGAEAYDKSFEKLYSGYEEDARGGGYYSAILPLPKELVDSHSHETDSLMLGALPRIMTAIGAGLLTGFEGKNYNKRRTSGSFGAGFGAGVAELAQYGVETAKARVGIGLNPNVEMIYSAPKPRSFTFNFELYPKNIGEKNNIIDFFNKAKKHSYPASVAGILGQNQLYIFPGEVYFEFTGRYRGKLFKSLRPCLITDISMSYSNGDQYQNFIDGSSIVYLITLSLTETRLLDRNIFEKDQQGEVDLTTPEGRDNVYGENTFTGEAIKEFLTSPVNNPNYLIQPLPGEDRIYDNA